MTRNPLTQDQDERRINAVTREEPLPAPRIPAALDGGLGWNDIESDPQASIIVQCGPWAELEPADVVRIFWGPNSVEVATYAVQEGGNYIINVPVPVRDIHNIGEGLMVVYYTIKTSFGFETVPSQIFNVRVKFNIPGGRDPQPDTPYLNENLAAPVVTPDPVPDNAQFATVTIVPWQYMAEGDILTVHWNGIPLAQPALTASDVNQTLAVTVPRQILEAAGGGERLPVTYSIRDTVNNWSLYAPYAFPEVQIEDPRALEAPDLDEADPVTGSLDVTGLTVADELTILVPRYMGISPGDRVVAHWHGRTAAGQEITWGSETYMVPTRIPFVIPFYVPASQAIPLAQGSLSISYVVVGKNGPQTSKVLRLTVTGQVQQLLPPQVAEARGSELDPADTPNGATVIVPVWAGMTVGDSVSLFWEGQSAAGGPTYHTDQRGVTGNGVGREMQFIVPAARVSELVNGSLKIYYQIDTYDQRLGGGVQPKATLRSPDLALQVRSGEVQPALPAPLVDGENNGYLPPTLKSTILRVPVYPGMKRGDRIDVSWLGRASFRDWLQVNIVGEQAFYVEGAYIAGNREQQVQASYAVTPQGGNTRGSDVLKFIVDEEITELVVPEVVEANNGVIYPSGLESLTLVVHAWPDMAFNDLLTYTWIGISAGGNSVTLSDSIRIPSVIVGRPVSFSLDADTALLPFNGGTVEAWYQVVPANGGTAKTSLHQTWRVGQAALLPAPVVEEAVGANIDPEIVVGSLHVQVRYPSVQAGDVVQVRWQGIRSDGVAGPLYQPPLRIVSQNEATQGGVRINVPQSQLTPYRDGRVVVSYTLGRIGGNELLASTEAEYQVQVQPALAELFEDFESTPIKGIPIGTQITLDKSKALLKNIVGEVKISDAGSSYLPASGHVLYLGAYADVRIDFPTEFGYIKFVIADSSRKVSRVIFLDKNNMELESVRTPPYNTSFAVWFEHTLTKGRVRSIRIIDGGGDSYVDNITVKAMA